MLKEVKKILILLAPPHKWIRQPEKILNIYPALKIAQIECQDFEKVCKRFDGDNTIHYLDPPYFGKEYYYKEQFTRDDHYRLAKMVNNLKGTVVISYYPAPEILDLYPENRWERRFFETLSTLSKSNSLQRTEMLLIRKQ